MNVWSKTNEREKIWIRTKINKEWNFLVGGNISSVQLEWQPKKKFVYHKKRMTTKKRVEYWIKKEEIFTNELGKCRVRIGVL